jgi:isopentenyl-diphosphate delta-isomerase
MRKVIKTNYYNQNCGNSEKIYAHQNKELHRAFSVFVHDGNGNMLIQKRAKEKYHSGGLWTNACCSHPITEDIEIEAKQRMREELGFSCEIEYVDDFIYYAEFENGINEFELDSIYVGRCDNFSVVSYDDTEVEEVKWINIDALVDDVCINPSKYTRWFITALYIVVRYLKTK